MEVREIMSDCVAAIGPEENAERAAQLMKDYGCGSLPVCLQGKVIGIVTDRDIALRTVAAGKDAKRQSVGQIMTPSPATGTPDMDVNDAAKLMSEKQVRRLPIVSADDIAGMLSLCDITEASGVQQSASEALKGISRPTGAQG
jgi:CBS domain-containing protein